MYYHPMISSLFPYTTLFRSVCSAVINQVDRTTDSRDVSRWLRQQFDSEGDGLVRVLNTTIPDLDRKSTRLNSSHVAISYAVFCLKKKKNMTKIINHILKY